MSKKPTIKDLEQKIGELTEALQRERADAENLRRRTEEERAKMAGFYTAMVVQELLPALDNLERAFKHTPKDLKDHDYVKGVQGVLKQFEQSFAQLGVKRIKTVGEVFDPRLHEAVHLEAATARLRLFARNFNPATLSATKSSATPWSKSKWRKARAKYMTENLPEFDFMNAEVLEGEGLEPFNGNDSVQRILELPAEISKLAARLDMVFSSYEESEIWKEIAAMETEKNELFAALTEEEKEQLRIYTLNRGKLDGNNG